VRKMDANSDARPDFLPPPAGARGTCLSNGQSRLASWPAVGPTSAASARGAAGRLRFESAGRLASMLLLPFWLPECRTVRVFAAYARPERGTSVGRALCGDSAETQGLRAETRRGE
jgi:hypothetical protein